MKASKKSIKKAQLMSIKSENSKLKNQVKALKNQLEAYQKTSSDRRNKWIEALRPLGDMQLETGKNNVQGIRYADDYIMTGYVGADLINENNNGWDGYFTELDMPYENKNISMNLKGGDTISAGLQDTSDEKLKELQKGVILTATVLKCCGRPSYALIGNTKNIGAIIDTKIRRIKKSIKEKIARGDTPSTRISPNIAFRDMVNNGFKIVALESTKEEVLDRLKLSQKRFAANITTADIYSKDDLKSLVAELAK